MKIKHFLVYVLIGAVMFVSGCDKKKEQQQNPNLLNLNVNEQIKDIPDMTIEYEYGLDKPDLSQKIDGIKPGTSYWHYYDGEQIIAIASDSVHPLDNLNNMVKINRIYEFPRSRPYGFEPERLIRIKVSFSYSPSYYTVRYWNEQYIGNASAYENYFQTMEVENDTIILPDGSNELNEEYGNGYIIEIKAVWESLNGIEGEGYAYYSFFVTNNILTE